MGININTMTAEEPKSGKRTIRKVVEHFVLLATSNMIITAKKHPKISFHQKPTYRSESPSSINFYVNALLLLLPKV